MARVIRYSGWHLRYDYIPPEERYAMDMEAKQVINPFKHGDRIETLDTLGVPLQAGTYLGHNVTTKGALRCTIRLDNGVTTEAYYPRRIRKEKKALAIVQPQCTAMIVYKPAVSNIIPFKSDTIVTEKRKIA